MSGGEEVPSPNPEAGGGPIPSDEPAGELSLPPKGEDIHEQIFAPFLGDFAEEEPVALPEKRIRGGCQRRNLMVTGPSPVPLRVFR